MRPLLLSTALALSACARTLPADRSAAALYRDLERLVTVAETTGWGIDRIEVASLEADALDSVCRVEPLARAALREWLDEQLGPPAALAERWRAAGRRLDALAGRLTQHRVRLVLAASDALAPVDCPFWLEPTEPFRGRQISDGRWQLHLAGGGKGMVVHQGDRTDLSGGGAGRLLLGKVLDDRHALYGGVEAGATAAFPKDADGNRGGLKLGVDLVAPVVYRYTLTNAYLEVEAGWLGRTTEDALDRLDHGVHLGASIGGRALRTRFFFPGASFGVSWERAFVDGDDLTTIKLGARVGFDVDLW